MKSLTILGLAGLTAQVHGHPYPVQEAGSIERRLIDISKFPVPELSTYSNSRETKNLPVAKRFLDISVRSVDYVETAAEFVSQTAPGLEFRVARDHYVGKNGIAHVYFRQTLHGLDVDNGYFNVNINPDGSVFTFGTSFFEGQLPEERALQKRDTIDPARALANAVNLVGFALELGDLTAESTDVTEKYVIKGTSGGENEPTVRLAYFNKGDGNLALSWVVETDIDDHWVLTYLDAATGEEIFGIIDHVFDATYEVYPWGLNSPDEGDRVVVEDPWHSVASEFAWHSDGSQNFTTTQGNNVLAVHNPSGTDSSIPSKYRPESSDLTFEYPLSLDTVNAAEYRDASITQLFYTVNKFHDLLYLVGFDEASGNFQTNNNGNGGLGNDHLIAYSQDGRTTNNAQYFPRPEGESPRIAMYMFTRSTPVRDSSFDTGVVIHEAGHGVSLRLTGGPLNSQCLSNVEGRGMGEGWSDFMATLVRLKEQDTHDTSYPIGEWVFNNPVGIRAHLYSTSLETNPLLYADVQGLVGHAIGHIWANMLYQVLWNLIDKLGKNDGDVPELDEDGVPLDGKYLALHLVVEGMKLHPCQPTLVTARDGILDADIAITGGANQCEIWSGFAKRGLGEGAEPLVYVNDFTIPDGVC